MNCPFISPQRRQIQDSMQDFFIQHLFSNTYIQRLNECRSNWICYQQDKNTHLFIVFLFFIFLFSLFLIFFIFLFSLSFLLRILPQQNHTSAEYCSTFTCLSVSVSVCHRRDISAFLHCARFWTIQTIYFLKGNDTRTSKIMFPGV